MEGRGAECDLRLEFEEDLRGELSGAGFKVREEDLRWEGSGCGAAGGAALRSV